MKRLLLVCGLGLLVPLAASSLDPAPATRPAMTPERLAALLQSIAPEARPVPGGLHFRIHDVEMDCIWDANHDRMRLITAIAPVSKLTPEHVGRILGANFHTALDARYATSQGYLYAAFIHPLSPLTESELRSGIAQVASLAQTFGTSYSSGQLEYGGSKPSI